MKPAHFVIGMDGGGTKTLALIADMKGEVLAQHVAGPTNIQIAGVEHVARTLYSLMMECCESAGATPAALRGLTVGLAGAGRAGDKTLMERELRRLLAAKRLRVGKIRVESDARVALEGAFKGE
ncbi:MAG TPA: BadF/BadG/BcrA/BcrD ATPase family protein, partial [Bacteroidota bacterium]|nr:BadF/BadG/BcrA/BcrD ATPase family protein [Bacteroidota bacterium]